MKYIKVQLKFFITFSLVLFFMAGVSQIFGQPSLKEVFKDYYLMGTALNNYQVQGNDPAALDLAKKQFNVVTPENMLKWEKVHPKPGVYNFEPVDSLIVFCERNNISIIGHTLIWHSQTPAWVFEDKDGKPATRELLLERMKEHILTVVGRYKGKIKGWDVVNEAFMEDGALRESKWLDIIGDAYIENAFRFAQEADPEAELYYNDFNMWYEGKVKSVVKHIAKLKFEGVKVDGIGLQGHWGLDYPELDELDAAMKAYSELDVNLVITELDLDILPNPANYTGAEISKNYELKKEFNPFPDSLPDSMQTVEADRYAEFFTIFNKYKDKVSRVTFWGISDKYSWRNNWPIKGRSAYPLIFDENFQPKPAFYAIIKTVKGK